jgi:hydroxypyruvate reductase
VTGRVLVLGFGKASGTLAAEVEPALLSRFGPERVSGFVVLPHAAPHPELRRLETLRAGHPRPDSGSLSAAERALAEAAALGPDDLLIALVSGGGSALLCAPAPGLAFETKLAVVAALLDAGAPVQVLNAARKRLSAVKGGRLAAAAAPARVLNLVVSDVPGDDPTLVASGPTAPDLGESRDVVAALRDFARSAPPEVGRTLLEASAPPPPGRLELPAIETALVRRPADALDAAAERARRNGWRVLNLGAEVVGPARAVAAEHAGMARALLQARRPGDPPVVVLSGGETTAPVRGAGRGGRNSEYLLALALELDGAEHVWAIAGDTDGWDGAGPHAGAAIGPNTLARARALGIDAARSLAASDSGGFFEATGGAIKTGHTGGNLNDFRAILLTS